MVTTLVGNGWGRYRRFEKDNDGFRLADFEASAWGDAFLTVMACKMTDLDVGPGSIDDVYRVLNMPKGRGELTGFRIHDLVCTNVKRGALRLKTASNGLVENVVARAIGEPFKDFPVGFALSDQRATDIVFRNCVATGFTLKTTKPGEYLNGDGFSTENNNDAIHFLDCTASDNADGGFDLKNTGLLMERCISERNGKNYRLWGNGELVDCVSADPKVVHMWFRLAPKKPPTLPLDGDEDEDGEGTGEEETGEDSGVPPEPPRIPQPRIYEVLRPVFTGPPRPHLRIDGASDTARLTVIDPVLPGGEPLQVQLKDTGGQATVQIVFGPGCPAVPVQVTREGRLEGTPGRVLVTVTEEVTEETVQVVTSIRERTFDAENPDAGDIIPDPEPEPEPEPVG
jgi:hypothetical protein